MNSPLSDHLLAQAVHARHHFWYRLRGRAFCRFVSRGATVLDVGAGAGVLGETLASDRPDVTYRFSEPDPVLRQRLLERFGAAAEHHGGDVLAPPAAVALLDVLEHVDDDVSLLRDVAKSLPPGARVVLTAPALGSLWSPWDDAVGHRRRYRLRAAKLAASDAGLRVVFGCYLFPELVPAGVIRKFLPRHTQDDFPMVPPWVNSALYAIGCLTQRLGRWTPIGTSVLVVCEVERSLDDRDT